MPEIIAEKYEVLETIGRGGMGTVYKARQTNLDRIVAIKMLSEELASDPEFRARFQQEATVVARLNHPNIVQVHDIEAHNNTFCIIMEFVDGENLQAKIDRDVTLPEDEVVRIGAQVARALAYAHSKGVIHRDIKPDNIHVTPKGVAKVMDFGIARFMDSKLKTQTGISMGTPKFMSPEQVTGKNVDGQTDLYSLGVCLYYCLAGRPPFDGENAISVATRHLYEQPEPPSKLNSSISPAVEKVILHAMEKQKQNRYATGNEMAEALEAALGMKTPVRLDTEAMEAYATDATQKMPAQAFGVAGTGGIVAGAGASGAKGSAGEESGEVAAVGGQAQGGTGHTIPQLEPDFRTPARESASSADVTRSFNRSLIIFGGMVVVAAILLILLVVWLRRSHNRENGLGSIPAPSAPSATAKFQVARQDAEDLLEAGKPEQALQVLTDFDERNPGAGGEAFVAEVDRVANQLPVKGYERVIARRRMHEFARFKEERGALAVAYYDAAVELWPEIINNVPEVGPTSSSISLLKYKLKSPSAEDVAAAKALLAQAAQAQEQQGKPADVREKYLAALATDFTSAQTWAQLGNFFLTHGQRDDARVMLREAIKHAGDAAERATLEQSLSKIQ